MFLHPFSAIGLRFEYSSHSRQIFVIVRLLVSWSNSGVSSPSLDQVLCSVLKLSESCIRNGLNSLSFVVS